MVVARAEACDGLGRVRVGWGRRVRLLMGCDSARWGELAMRCEARGTMAAACAVEAVGELGALDCRVAAKREAEKGDTMRT